MKTYLNTFLLVAILLFFTLQQGNGFLLFLFLPFFLVRVFYDAVRMCRRPAERKSRLIRLAIWCAALAVAGSVQTWWKVGTRNNADIAAQRILEHRDRTGMYPATLGEVGLDEATMRKRWKIRYWVRGGAPVLVYPVPFIPFDMYEFDFAARTWRENPY